MSAIVDWLRQPAGTPPAEAPPEASLRSLQVQLGITRASIAGLERDYRLAAMLAVGSPEDDAAQQALREARGALQVAQDRVADLTAAIEQAAVQTTQETAAAADATRQRQVKDVQLAIVATDGTTVATDAAAAVSNNSASLTSVNTLISAIGSGAGSADAAALKILLQTGSTDLATLSTDVTTLQTAITTSQTDATQVVTDLDNLSDITVLMNLGKAMTRKDVTNGGSAIARWLQDGRALLNYYLPL